MCRHTAYLGPPATLASLLTDPPHSLFRQSWAPRRQRYGTVNADGFGIGWYAAGAVPARYRRGTPIWGDESLPDIARVTSSGAVLAAVRSATSGMARGAEAAAPFGHGPWLFSHNGVAEGWRDWAEHALVLYRRARAGGDSNGSAVGAAAVSAARPGVLSTLEALVDSAFLWTLVLDGLQAGDAMDAALAGTIGAVAAAGGSGRFNFLLTDGRSIAATACGDTLCYRQAGGAVTVASEPDDDEPGWTEVPDRHLLTATAGGVTVRPLDGAPAGGPGAGSDLNTGGEASTGGQASPAGEASPDSDVSTEGIVIA
ncbi:MAG TPA: ergothioneine biosynthesis protein EgtC [Trebonia sp.]|jgi:glutamine amidotransferase|nr:ergothioneine biosynthesis protein EgtC [Trebonia sp.]